MSQYHINQHITDTSNEIMRQSNEYKMYELGLAYGFYQMLQMCKPVIDNDAYNIIIEGFKKGDETYQKYFNKLIELGNLKNSKTDDFAEKYQELKLLRFYK